MTASGVEKVGGMEGVCVEGNYVILDFNGDRQALVKLKKGGTVRVGKTVCSMDPLLGAAYGSLFDVDRNRLEKRQRICESAGEAWEGSIEIKANNSELNDAGTANQSLTTTDIEKMRAEGKTGDDIIAALTANSATFANKTQYSQDKYKKKKAKKYLNHVTLIRPCARSLADFYFQKMPMKIAGMRSDTLAILLSLANISADSRTLVVDSVGGLVAGSAIERMGGRGAMINAYIGDKKPSQDIASSFNFPADYVKAIPVSLATLRDYNASKDTSGPAQEGNKLNSDDTKALSETVSKARTTMNGASTHREPSEQNEPVSAAKDAKTHDEEECEVEASEQAPKRVKLNTGEASAIDTQERDRIQQDRDRIYQERRENIEKLCRQQFQCCIVANTHADPTSIVKAVLPFLAPSASLAIYFPSLQPLVECLEDLKANKTAVGLQVQESWWREYQVLPGRTHPTMATSGTGGYILSGTIVASDAK